MSAMGFVANVFAGWARGHAFSEDSVTGDSYKQGGNYYLGTPHLVGQAIALGSLFLKISETMLKSKASARTTLLCNVAPLLTIPLFAGVAYLQEKKNNSLILTQVFDKSKSLVAEVTDSIPSPELPKLTYPRLMAVVSFFAEHSSKIMRVAMIVSVIALIPLGEYAYAGAALLALGYEAACRANRVPLSVQGFAETYLPVIDFVGEMIGGTLVERVTVICSEPLNFLPGMALFIQQKIDLLFKRCFGIKKPTLIECEKPIIEKRNLTFHEIEAVLNGKDEDFVIAPPHLTKYISLDGFAKDKDFSKFITYFNLISWEERYPIILAKLSAPDEDQFKVHLNKYLTEEDKFAIDANLKLDFTRDGNTIKVCTSEKNPNPLDVKYRRTHCALMQLAQKNKLSPETYAANYIRDELNAFIEVITGKAYSAGDPHDIEISASYAEIFGPYLNKLLVQRSHLEAISPKLENATVESLSEIFSNLDLEHYETLEETVKTALKEYADIYPDTESLKDFLKIIDEEKLDLLTQFVRTDISLKSVEFEDILLKLSVDAGTYCTEQHERATEELVDAIIEAAADLPMTDSARAFERKIFQTLKLARKKIVQAQCATILDSKLLQLVPETVRKNMHIERSMRSFLSLGFYTISDHQRSEISVLEFLSMELTLGFLGKADSEKKNEDKTYLESFKSTFDNYLLNDFFKEYRSYLNTYARDVKPVHLTEYIRGLIQKNTSLKERHKTYFEDLFAKGDNLEGFHRLALVQLGYLEQQ